MSHKGTGGVGWAQPVRRSTSPPSAAGGIGAAGFAALLLVFGCGTAEAPSPSPAEPGAQPLSELSAGELASLLEDDSESWARRGEASRRLSLLHSGEEADSYLAGASAIYELAAAQREGGCGPALARSRLAAADQRQLGEAYRWAERAAGSGTSQGAPSHSAPSDCVREARRIMAALSAYRLLDRQEEPVPDAAEGDLERWARQNAGDGGELESITVYGRGDDAGEHTGSAQTARAVLELSGVAVFRPGELEASADGPRRFFLDLPNTAIASELPRTLAVDAAGVTRVRVGSNTPNTTRVVFELSAAATYNVFFLPSPFRIVIDFEALEATSVRELDVIVIDPGHGGNDYGARANGLRESILTLDLSQRVATKLEQQLENTRILLTRRNDTPVSLEERVAFANAVGADLFVSIHLNGWEEQLERGGVTTFVLDDTNDQQAIRLAARENNTDASDVSGMQRILAGLHREEQVGLSRELATLIQESTVRSGRQVIPRLPDRGVRSAMFYVLVGARMPAVLVEASFLTQEDEGRALGTDEYRDALASGIASGIQRFIAGESER